MRKHSKDAGVRRPNVTASSATLELDQLMQNLEDFEPPAAAPSNDPSGGGNQKPKSAMDDLSNMLGSLEQDMEHIHGVSTVAKGMCAACKKPILAKVLDALGRQWHPEHFFCTLCGKKFGAEGFHEKDSKAYCRECYYENYAPRCKRCDKAIMEGFITALNAQWHPECFSCKVNADVPFLKWCPCTLEHQNLLTKDSPKVQRSL